MEKELDGECTRTVGVMSKIDQVASEPKILASVKALLPIIRLPSLLSGLQAYVSGIMEYGEDEKPSNPVTIAAPAMERENLVARLEGEKQSLEKVLDERAKKQVQEVMDMLGPSLWDVWNNKSHTMVSFSEQTHEPQKAQLLLIRIPRRFITWLSSSQYLLLWCWDCS